MKILIMPSGGGGGGGIPRADRSVSVRAAPYSVHEYPQLVDSSMSSSGVSGTTGASFAMIGGGPDQPAQAGSAETLTQQQQTNTMNVDTQNVTYHDDQR